MHNSLIGTPQDYDNPYHLQEDYYLNTLPVSQYWNGVLDRVIPDRKLSAKMKQDGSRKRAHHMTPRSVHQRRAVNHEFHSPESLRQNIYMLLLCSYVNYVQNSDFSRADQFPDEMEFHVNVLASRRATWIIRDCLCALVITKNIYSHATQLRLEENQNRFCE